jgi:hypothetical protein
MADQPTPQDQQYFEARSVNSIGGAAGPAGGAEGSDWLVIVLGAGGVTLFAGGLALTARAHSLRHAPRRTA